MSTLVAGNTLCLHGPPSFFGTYSGAWSIGRAGTAAAPITVRAYPGETPVLESPYTGSCRNTFTMTSASQYVVVGPGLTFDRDNVGGLCENFAAVFFNGADNTTFTGNSVTNATEHGVFGGYGAANDTITRSYFYNVGNPDTDNADHAIYCDDCSNLRVTRNLVVHTPNGHAIQIYNGPTNAVVAGNVVVDTVCVNPCGNSADHSTAGIIVADNQTTGTHVVNNIVYGNSRGIFGWQTGNTNEAHSNVAFNNAVCNICNGQNGSLVIGANTYQDPMFVSYPNDLHVQLGSPAVDSADGAYVFFPDYDGATQVIGLGPDIGPYEAH